MSEYERWVLYVHINFANVIIDCISTGKMGHSLTTGK